MYTRFFAVLTILATVGIGPELHGQGRTDYCNFESPLLRPMTLARVGGQDWLLVCNSPDSSLEIYDTVTLTRVARIPTGLAPASVVYNAKLGVAYTANAIGDSITRVVLSIDGKALRARLDRTEWVGDSPMGIAFSQDGATLFVTNESQSAIGVRDARTLKPLAPGFERVDLVDDWSAPVEGVKEPRAIDRVGNSLFVLGFRGGHSFYHDFDLWSLDLKTLRIRKLGGLGTQKANFRADSKGRLWVVASDAQNQLRGLAAVAKAPTGFVKSLLHRVDAPGTASASVATRDLNLDVLGKPVDRARALAQPFDLALMEQNGEVRKVFVAAFGSDRVGVVDARDTDPAKWAIRAIALPLRAKSRSGMAGPRGLVFKAANPAVRGDPGPRVYVFNRLDATIVEIDPDKELVTRMVELAHDPVPTYIRRGQRFLYSAKLSGSGFVSCASCHIDGRTDGLGWDLSDAASPKPLPPALIDGVTDALVRGAKNFPATKGIMVTQSLQGLVQSEVAPGSGALFSTVPHHWRGDQDFLAFNGAFVDLQGMPNLSGPNEPVRGVSERQMREFEEFAHSIHYPPNPEQPKDRRHSGSLGDPDKQDGSYGARGLKLFHTEPIADVTRQNDPDLAGRSCVQCHSLPDGSNHKITRTGITNPQPVETPTLRGLQQKEAVIERGGVGTGFVVLGEFGTEHSGAQRSINEFNATVFGHDFPGPRMQLLEAITTFTREFDHGVAPLVGFPITVDRTNATSAGVSFALGFYSRQVREANVGLVAHVETTKGSFGYSFDPLTSRWTEEVTGASLETKTLLASLQSADDRLVFQAVPLGDERRLAATDGVGRVRRGPAPSRIRLETMRPMVAYRDVPRLTKNWVPGKKSDPLSFFWDGAWSDNRLPVATPASLTRLRIFQYGLIQDAQYTMQLRHEAPRRFRVSGMDIRPGARLLILVSNDQGLPPPHSQLDKMIPIDMPLYASGERTASGAPIWETAAEAAPELGYVLALGGPAAPGVRANLADRLPEPPSTGSFQPATWNRHWVWVLNEDGTYGNGGWQPLVLD